jgi:hypothetical protein
MLQHSDGFLKIDCLSPEVRKVIDGFLVENESRFFGDLYAIVRNHLFLSFCRITDAAGSGKRLNLTTNFIVEHLPWRPEVKRELGAVNKRLMEFRGHIEPARSKRIAHMDLRTQLENVGPLGGFPTGADESFLADLGEFLNIAYYELTNGPFLLSIDGAIDTHELIRALVKGRLYDGCKLCSDIDRINAVLDVEQSM